MMQLNGTTPDRESKVHLQYRCAAVFIIATLLSVSPGWAAPNSNPNYRLCFPQVVGVPVLTAGTDPCQKPLIAGQPPSIDGCIIGDPSFSTGVSGTGDPGWTGAFRYVFGNGTAFEQGAIQGIADGSFLYLSFEVYNDPSYDDNDVVIIGFSPDGTPANDFRIHIYPNTTNAARVAGSAPRLLELWKNSSAWTKQTGLPQPDSVIAAISNASSNSQPGRNNWFIEVKMRFSDFGIPSSGPFGLYFDVIPIDTAGDAPQYYWPARSKVNGSNGVTGNVILNPSVVDTNTPDPSNWGVGTLKAASGQACMGVSLDWTNISNLANGVEGDTISVPSGAGTAPSNTFQAKPSNNSVSGIDGTTAITASNVKATFSIANFGLPSEWTPVPVGNPTGSVTLGANCTPTTCATLQTSPPWQITDPTLIGKYLANPDQCILVDLDVAFPSTSNCVANPTQCVTFINKSARRNMLVEKASSVSKTAEVSAKGYPAHPGHPGEQEFLLRVLRRQEVLTAKSQSGPVATHGSATTGSGPRNPTEQDGRVVSRLWWAVQGCRRTGQFIKIKDQTLETCDDVGAFGAVVTHSGSAAVNQWSVLVRGSGISKIDDANDTYRLRVPDGTVGTVNITFIPKETPSGGKRLALFFDLGAAIPHGTFSNAFNTGFSLNGGLEYMFNPHLSAEGIIGYHRFGGKATSDENVLQFSGGGKVYSSAFGGNNRLFGRGGVGVYHFTLGTSTNFGLYAGAGLLHDFNHHLGIEGSYTFHAVNTPASATQFSAVQGGLRWVF